MKTLVVEGEVSADRVLRLEVPCDLTPGPVEVVLTIPAEVSETNATQIDWSSLSGLGREIWEGIDASRYLDDLRSDRGDTL